MRELAIRAASAAVILLGLLLSGAVLLPSEIVLWPYHKYGWLGAATTLFAMYLISLFAIYALFFVYGLVGFIAYYLFSTKIELVTDEATLKKRMIETVRGARSYLGAAGSRMRDIAYLNAIEDQLRARPKLLHTRILFGPPQLKPGTEHIRRLRSLRSNDELREGEPSIKIGLYEADPSQGHSEPERNYCISERMGVIILQSHTGLGNFDTALLVRDRTVLHGWKNYTEALYAACNVKVRKEHELALVRTLPIRAVA